MTELHAHSDLCLAEYEQWKNHHRIVVDMRARYSRPEIIAAREASDRLEIQMQARGCSGEAIRKIEKESEIGSETEVFNGFSNLEMYRPTLMIVEIEDSHPDFQAYENIIEKNSKLRDYILSLDYIEVYKDEINTVFQNGYRTVNNSDE